MAETYRRSKIEKFYNQVKWELDYSKKRLEQSQDLSYTKPYLDGEIAAYERILRKLKEEFDLTAE